VNTFFFSFLGNITIQRFKVVAENEVSGVFLMRIPVGVPPLKQLLHDRHLRVEDGVTIVLCGVGHPAALSRVAALFPFYARFGGGLGDSCYSLFVFFANSGL
jgi:hypothetical protein